MIVTGEKMRRVSPERIEAVRKTVHFRKLAHMLVQMPDPVLEALQKRDGWIRGTLRRGDQFCLLGHLNAVFGCSCWWLRGCGYKPMVAEDGSPFPTASTIPHAFDALCGRFGTGVTVTAIKRFIAGLK